MMTKPKDGCFPVFTALDVFESFTSGVSRSFSHHLRSANADGVFEAKTAIEGKFAGNTLELRVTFEFDGVALPYNIFALLVATAEDVLAWYDLTGACTGPGVGIFPGQYFDFPAIKIADPGETELRIVVWGR